MQKRDEAEKAEKERLTKQKKRREREQELEDNYQKSKLLNTRSKPYYDEDSDEDSNKKLIVTTRNLRHKKIVHTQADCLRGDHKI